MAVIKYKDANGNWQTVVGVVIQNEVVQETGNSETAVMSQKAVSNKLVAMTGASASAAGASGLVPAPAAGDQGKFLKGDGSWGEVSAQDSRFVVQTGNCSVLSYTLGGSNTYRYYYLPYDTNDIHKIYSIHFYFTNGKNSSLEEAPRYYISWSNSGYSLYNVWMIQSGNNTDLGTVTYRLIKAI